MTALPTKLYRILAALALIGTAFTVVTTLIIIDNSYFPLPFQDSCALWQRYLYFGNYAAFLFEPHNEHRIPVIRLFFILDRYCFHGRSLFPLICSLCFQLGSGFCIYRIISRTPLLSRSRIFLACLVASAMASAQQFDNLTLGFMMEHPIICCLAVLSFLLLISSSSGRYPDLSYILACLCAVLVTFTAANGLFFWCVLFVFSVWLRLPKRHICGILVDTILVSSFYLRNYPVPSLHLGSAVDLVKLPLGAAAFLGSACDILLNVFSGLVGVRSHDTHLVFAVALGALGIVLFLGSIVSVWHHPARFTPYQGALVHIAAFIVLTAFLFGFARAATDALAAKYVTYSTLFWLSMFGFYWSLAERRIETSSTPWTQLVPNAATLCLIMVGSARLPYWIAHSKDFAATLRQEQAAIVANVFDEPQWQIAYPPSGAMILPEVDYLRRNRFSVFTESWTHWVGQNITSLFAVDVAGSCLGAVDNATPVTSPVRPGWRISGWAWNQRRQAAAGIVLLVDEGGRIAGVVNNAFLRPDVPRMLPLVHSQFSGWRGYVAGSLPPHLTAYLLEKDSRSLCAVGHLP